MNMEMKNRLATIGIRIHDHPIAFVRDARFVRDIAREGEQAAEQVRILRIVERADMCRRDDEEMRRRLRIQVAEGKHVVFALDDGRGNFTRGNPAKQAARHS